MQSLNQIGFNQELPFDIKMSESQYSNMDKIETQIELADSGYGQGRISGKSFAILQAFIRLF